MLNVAGLLLCIYVHRYRHMHTDTHALRHTHTQTHIIYYHVRSRVSDRPVKSGLLTQFVSVGEVCGRTAVASEPTGICSFYTCEEESVGADETEEAREREGWRERNGERVRILLRKREKSRKEERERQITGLCGRF